MLKSNAYQVIYIDLPEFEKQARGIIKTGADAIQGGGIIVGGKPVEASGCFFALKDLNNWKFKPES